MSFLFHQVSGHGCRDDSYAIFNTIPNTLAAEVHDRMPIFLNAARARARRDRDYKALMKLDEILLP